MPEAGDLLAASPPMHVRQINDLKPLNEHEEFREEKTEVAKSSSFKSTCTFLNPRTDGTEETVEDDYGFFPMDDDDDFLSGGTPAQSVSSHDDAASTSNSDTSSEQLGSSYGSSSTGRRRRRMKSALKRGSVYGDGDDAIPLDFERKEFNRVLPKPDLSRRSNLASSHSSKGIIRSGSRGLFRVSSEPVFVRPLYQPEDDDVDDEDEIQASVQSGGFVEGAMKKRISFGTIKIREHVQTIGDNPSCSYGTPVQLDWEHQDLEELDVDLYETNRPRTRRKEEFHLNHFQRRNLLKLNGYSHNEIKTSKKEVGKCRSQRERTKFLQMNYPQLAAVEGAIESGLRKVKRSVSKSKLNANKNGERIPRKSSKDDLGVHSSGISKALLLQTMDNDISNVTAPF